MIKQDELENAWLGQFALHLNYIFDWSLPCPGKCGPVTVTSDGFLIGDYEGLSGKHPGAFLGSVDELLTDLDEFVVAEQFDQKRFDELNDILKVKYGVVLT